MSGGVGGEGREERGRSGGGEQCSGTERSPTGRQTLRGTPFSYCHSILIQSRCHSNILILIILLFILIPHSFFTCIY